MIDQMKLLGLALLAILILSAVAASLTFAAEMKLPEVTVVTKGTGISGASTFFGPAEIKCSSGSGTGTDINKKEGTVTGEFKDCLAFDEGCHSLGDSEAVILGDGTTKLVLDTVGGIDHRLVLTEAPPLHVECKFLNTLVLVTGSVLGTFVAKTGSKNKFEIGVHAKSKTTQEFKEYEDDNGTKVTGVHLGLSVDEGSVEEYAEELGTTEISTEKETELIN